MCEAWSSICCSSNRTHERPMQNCRNRLLFEFGDITWIYPWKICCHSEIVSTMNNHYKGSQWWNFCILWCHMELVDGLNHASGKTEQLTMKWSRTRRYQRRWFTNMNKKEEVEIKEKKRLTESEFLGKWLKY